MCLSSVSIFGIILLNFLCYMIFFLDTCVKSSNFGANFLIQDFWLAVVMLCAYTQFVFESFSQRQITIFSFPCSWSGCDSRLLLVLFVIGLLLCCICILVDLCAFGGTKHHAFDHQEHWCARSS